MKLHVFFRNLLQAITIMSQSITGLGDTKHEAVIPLPGTFDVTRFF